MTTLDDQPHNAGDERRILGAMLQNRETYDRVTTNLHLDDFYLPEHQRAYEAIVHAATGLEHVSPDIFSSRLEELGLLDKVGGPTGIADLTQSAPTLSNIDYFIDSVRADSTRRRIIMAGRKIEQMGRAHDADVKNVVDAAVGAVFDITGDLEARNDLKPAGDYAHDMLDRLDRIAKNPHIEDGVPTGFECIDRVTHGLHSGQMIVVAGRPAMGKSTLAMDFARSAALHHDIPTAVFSLEMGGDELMRRVFSAETGVMLVAFNDPSRFDERGWEALNQQYERVRRAPLYLDDGADATMDGISAKCRRLNRLLGGKLGLVVVDYMQLMSSGRREENRQQEVSKFSRGMKLLAKELECPVVVLSQLNRMSEQRGDKRPQLSDLRESGAIEQDADVVFLVHRPEYYDREERPGEADVILAKHRNGPTDTFALAFCGATSCFREMADVSL